jgi:hypothetical protein
VLSCKKHEEDDNTARAEDIKDYKWSQIIIVYPSAIELKIRHLQSPMIFYVLNSCWCPVDGSPEDLSVVWTWDWGDLNCRYNRNKMSALNILAFTSDCYIYIIFVSINIRFTWVLSTSYVKEIPKWKGAEKICGIMHNISKSHRCIHTIGAGSHKQPNTVQWLSLCVLVQSRHYWPIRQFEDKIVISEPDHDSRSAMAPLLQWIINPWDTPLCNWCERVGQEWSFLFLVKGIHAHGYTSSQGREDPTPPRI